MSLAEIWLFWRVRENPDSRDRGLSVLFRELQVFTMAASIEPAIERRDALSSSAVLRGYLDLLGVGERPDRQSAADLRELRRHTRRLERRVRDLESRNRDLSRELEARRASATETRSEPGRRGLELEGLRRLSGALGHVFNNLMTAVSCSADFLRTALPDESENHEHLDTLDRAWKRGSQVCRRLLTASGQAPFTAAPLDLNEVVRQTEPVVAASLGKRARIELRLDAEAVPLAGDATLLRQLILELTANAAEAIGEGPGRVTISTRRRSGGPTRPAAETWAVLEVADDGHGMEPDQVARIFDPFFSTKFLGRGLGLTAAYSIVEKHRGTIRIESQPGRGSTFQILLPALPS